MFLCGFWHPKYKTKADVALFCLSKYDFGERLKEKFAVGYKLIDLAHISIWWLKIIDWKIDRLLHLLTVTFLFLCAFIRRLFACAFSRRDTDGTKRRFIVKTNKKSINLSRWRYLVQAINDGDNWQVRNKASSLPNNRWLLDSHLPYNLVNLNEDKWDVDLSII